VYEKIADQLNKTDQQINKAPRIRRYKGVWFKVRKYPKKSGG